LQKTNLTTLLNNTYSSADHILHDQTFALLNTGCKLLVQVDHQRYPPSTIIWHYRSNWKYCSHRFQIWNSRNDIISQESNSAPKTTNNYKV